ncbi:MAG TPA: DUF1214 domain-containing protein [Macromonas sp.]|nr:DUF1214 domain-containing protein [Macromonas sp.]
METATPALRDAWAEYHATLEHMRQLTEASAPFQGNAQHRAKAYHTLMEAQAMAYNFVIAPRMSHPRIWRNIGWQTDVYTLGQNCQDLIYGVLFVDGRQTYRMKGRMGDLKVFLLQVQNGIFGEPDVKVQGNYDWANFQIEADGRFEVILSPDEQPGNWIRLDPAHSFQFLHIRRSLTDWNGDAGELDIERISALPDDFYDADEFDEAAMAVRIRRATLFVRYLVKAFNLNLYDMYMANAGGRKNVLSLLPGTTTSQVGSPSNNTAMAIFSLQPDEALILELDEVPSGDYWSFQLGDVWSRSLDHSNRMCTLNDREVSVDADGKVRVVVSLQDPGLQNWMDPCGRVEGTVVFRNYRSSAAPVPASRLVKFADLARELPADTRRVTPAERQQAMALRRQGQRKIYGE